MWEEPECVMCVELNASKHRAGGSRTHQMQGFVECMAVFDVERRPEGLRSRDALYGVCESWRLCDISTCLMLRDGLCV